MDSNIVIDISENNDIEGTVYNKIEKKVYKLGEKEYKVWKLLNEHTDIQTIYSLCDFYSQYEIDLLIKKLLKYNLINNSENHSKRHFKWNEIKIGICYPERKLKSKIKLIKTISITTNVLFMPLLICALIDGIRKIKIIKSLYSETNLIYIGVFSFVLMLISLIIHEWFHAIEAKRWGAKVAEFGIKIYYGIPVAYTTICGLEKISIKGKIFISLAGMKVNALIIFISVIMIGIGPKSVNIIIESVLLSNIFPILGNLSIYYKFDLYYVCTYLIGERELISTGNTKSNRYPVYNFIVKLNDVILLIIILMIIYTKINF